MINPSQKASCVDWNRGKKHPEFASQDRESSVSTAVLAVSFLRKLAAMPNLQLDLGSCQGLKIMFKFLLDTFLKDSNLSS